MPGRIRIIGGTWRSRRLDVIDAPGLRPTPDRVRETLFNWLQPLIEGARCLDLYAGSGSLGFEALSRGAAAVTMVEQNPALATNLKAGAAKLGATGLTIVCADALTWAAKCEQTFDIVFLDPPYAQNGSGQITGQLLNCPCLHKGTLLYIESDQPIESGDERLQVRKSGRAGSVHFGLYEYTGNHT